MLKKPAIAAKTGKSKALASAKVKPRASVEAVAKPKAAKGRPSDYKAEYAKQARKLCLLGSTDAEMADFFGTSEQTLNAWKIAHPEFLESIRSGKEIADADVAEKLLHRATGYSHKEDDIRVVNGVIVITPTIKHYPPDTPAAIHWLNNRQRTKWRSKIDNEVSGPNGGPQEHKVDMTLSPDEAYLRLIGK